MRSLINNFCLYLFSGLIMGLVTFSAGCSRPQKNTTRVSFSLPNTHNFSTLQKSSPSTRGLSLPESWGQDDPSTLDDISCFAILMNFSEGETASGFCRAPNGEQILNARVGFGLFAPSAHVQLEVSAGKARQFYLIGWKSTTLCSSGPIQDRRNYSAPFILGRSPLINLTPGEASPVLIEAALNTQSKLEDCAGIQWRTDAVVNSPPAPVDTASPKPTSTAIATATAIATVVPPTAVPTHTSEPVSSIVPSPTASATATATPISSAVPSANSPSFSYIQALGTSTLAADSTITLTLQAQNSNGIPMTTGGANIGFSFSGGTSGGIISNVNDLGNGTYVATFTGTTAGSSGTFSATINGSLVTGGSTQSLAVTSGPVSLSNSYLSLSNAAVAWGETSLITLTLRDTQYNFISSGGAVISMGLSGGSSSGTFSAITDNGNGTYSATFTATTPGTATTVTATIGGQAITSALPTLIVNPMMLSVQPTYAINGAQWNDYIAYSNPGADPFHQSDASCTGSETGGYGRSNGCIHGGELRKVIVPNVSNCTNLSASDQLAVFDWKCFVDGGVVTFYSLGLKKQKGLRDLITGAGASGNWLNNQVSILSGATTIGVSSALGWWTNPIEPLPSSSSSVVALSSGVGKIYYTHANTNVFGIFIDSPKMAMVTLGASTLTYNGSSVPYCNSILGGTGATVAPMICSSNLPINQRFLWLELNLNGFDGTVYKAHGGIVGVGMKFSRLHLLSIMNLHTNSTAMGGSGLYLRSSQSNLISDLSVYSASDGVRLYDSIRNQFENLDVASAAQASACASTSKCSLLTLDQNSFENHFYDTRLANASNGTHAVGININMSPNNTFVRTMVSNIQGNNISTPTTNSSEGILLSGGSTQGNIFSQLAINATRDAGIFINGVNGNIFSHFSSNNNIYNGVYFSTLAASNNVFHSGALFNSQKPIETFAGAGSTGNHISNMAIASFTHPNAISTQSSGASVLNFSGYLITRAGESCLGNEMGGVSTSCTGGGLSLHFTESSANWSNAIRGAVTTNDIVNAVDATGTANISTQLTTLLTWFDFEHPLRSWGLNGTFGTTGSQGACTTGICRIWDLSVITGGPLENKSYFGSTPNGVLNTDGAPCAANTVNPINTIATTVGIVFSKTAVELDHDGKGNDNGLCESYEDCLWAPNIGADQGRGTLSIGFCTVDDGGGPGQDGIRVFKSVP